MRKYNRFSSLVARNSFWEIDLKNFEKFDFCSEVSAFLVDFLPQRAQRTQRIQSYLATDFTDYTEDKESYQPRIPMAQVDTDTYGTSLHEVFLDRIDTFFQTRIDTDSH